jgi:hypothetical protein
MKAFVMRSLPAALLCAGLASPPAHATVAAAQVCCGGELWNGWEVPNGNPTAFEIDFTGDQTATIPAQVNTAMINPFYALFLYNGTPYNPTTVTYDASANLTRIVFSGGPLPNPVPSPGWPGPSMVKCGVATYHFGINGGYPVANASASTRSATMITPVSMHWIYPTTTFGLPVLMANWAGTFKKKDVSTWAAIYTETTPCGGVGGWQLVPYAAQAGTAVKINLTNGGQDAITVGTTGYILGIPTPTDADCKRTPACQANQTALDNLNDESFPIPGEPGSPFTPVKVNKTLQPGESITLKLQ